MLRKLIYETYKNTVALAQVPQELKNALKTSERVPTFINRLVKEFRKIPDAKKETVILAVTDLTNLFLNNIEKKAKIDGLSQIAKAEYQKAKQREEEFKKAADKGIVTEEFLENA